MSVVDFQSHRPRCCECGAMATRKIELIDGDTGQSVEPKWLCAEHELGGKSTLPPHACPNCGWYPESPELHKSK